jgi:hypothetical protein
MVVGEASLNDRGGVSIELMGLVNLWEFTQSSEGDQLN